MRIIRVIYYSIFMIVFAAIGLTFMILFNGGMFDQNSSPNSITIVDRSNFTPMPPTNAPVSTSERPNHTSFITVLADLNVARQAAGAGTLSFDPKLGAAAAVQANYNASLGYLSHLGPKDDYVQHRVDDQGYRWSNVAENLLSRWDIDGHEVFKQWQNSPDHNKNMMNPVYTEIGLAYMISSRGQVFFVMVLAKPR